MKTILFVLFLALSLKAQIFSETFSSFAIETLDDSVQGYWVFDDVWHTAAATGLTINQDLSNSSNDMTANAFSANFADELTSGSIIHSGGNFLTFNGSSEYFSRTAAIATDFNPGASDFSILVWFKSSSATAQRIWCKQQSTVQYIILEIDPTTSPTLHYWLKASAGTDDFKAATTVTDGNWKYVAFTVNRTTDVAQLYINGAAEGAAQDISGITGTFAPNIAQTIGRRADVAQYYLNGGMQAVLYIKKALTLAQVTQYAYLASNWLTHADGNVARSNWGFHQGIWGSGLTVKTKASGSGDGFSYTPTLTGSSQTFTERFALPFEFDTDSLLLVTSTDSIWKAIADTTLATGDSLQLRFDAWETGGVVYIDNIAISGYNIPPTTAGGQFKGNDYFDRFKGW